MSYRSVPFRSGAARAGLLALASLLAVACGETPTNSLPAESSSLPTAQLQGRPHRPDGRVASTVELEPFAQNLARFLATPRGRRFLANEFRRSRVKEQKVELRSLLAHMLRDPGAELTSSSRTATQSMATSANEYAPIEVYIPFADQRARWTENDAVQVVAILDDDDDPIAYQGDGSRSVLSKTAKPAVTTVVVTAAEQSFTTGSMGSMICDPDVTDCSSGGGGGSGDDPPPPPADTSLFMTRLKIDSDYESIFKGSPEFEVHILGPAGTTDSVTTMQCAGEHAGTPYAFDYNDTDHTWTGNVLLFSKAQMAAFHSGHPGKAFRVFVVEDDDESCVLRMDETEVQSMFALFSSTFSGLDAAIDTTFNLVNTLKAGNAVYNFLSSLANFILTKDDLVGTALADSVVGEYFTDANWVIRGPGNSTKGYMKLEMKP